MLLLGDLKTCYYETLRLMANLSWDLKTCYYETLRHTTLRPYNVSCWKHQLWGFSASTRSFSLVPHLKRMAACVHFYEKHAAILCVLKIVYLFLVSASNFNLATTNLARSSSRPSLPLSGSSSRANCLFRVATWLSRPLFSAQNSPKSELHVWMVNFEWARKVCRQRHAQFFLLFFCKRQNLGKIVDLFLKSQSAPGEDALVVD